MDSVAELLNASTRQIASIDFRIMKHTDFDVKYSLITLNLSAKCGGRCLNLVYRHPSQLSLPEVATTVPPQLQPYWLKIYTVPLC